MKHRLQSLLVISVLMGAMALITSDGGSRLGANIVAQPGTQNYENLIQKEEDKLIQELANYQEKSDQYTARASRETDPEKRELYAQRAQRYQDAASEVLSEIKN